MDTDTTADLRSYYEEEAHRRMRRSPRGRRVELRDRFLELLRGEDRRSVVDLGAGPGGDGAAFCEAGLRYVGLDLANGNGVLAAAKGVTVVQGSISAPPFRPASFDAGWSMSTVMHLPTDAVPAALAAMVEPLRPGAPLLVGTWGGEQGDVIDDRRIEGQRRLFAHRPVDLNRSLLQAVGAIEHEERWEPAGSDDEEYQVFRVRISARTSA